MEEIKSAEGINENIVIGGCLFFSYSFSSLCSGEQAKCRLKPLF
jgi:hypothetical protein